MRYRVIVAVEPIDDSGDTCGPWIMEGIQPPGEFYFPEDAIWFARDLADKGSEWFENHVRDDRNISKGLYA